MQDPSKRRSIKVFAIMALGVFAVVAVAVGVLAVFYSEGLSPLPLARGVVESDPSPFSVPKATESSSPQDLLNPSAQAESVAVAGLRSKVRTLVASNLRWVAAVVVGLLIVAAIITTAVILTIPAEPQPDHEDPKIPDQPVVDPPIMDDPIADVQPESEGLGAGPIAGIVLGCLAAVVVAFLAVSQRGRMPCYRSNAIEHPGPGETATLETGGGLKFGDVTIGTSEWGYIGTSHSASKTLDLKIRGLPKGTTVTAKTGEVEKTATTDDNYALISIDVKDLAYIQGPGTIEKEYWIAVTIPSGSVGTPGTKYIISFTDLEITSKSKTNLQQCKSHHFTTYVLKQHYGVDLSRSLDHLLL